MRRSKASRRNNTGHENAVEDAWTAAEVALARLKASYKRVKKFEWEVIDKSSLGPAGSATASAAAGARWSTSPGAGPSVKAAGQAAASTSS